MDGGQHDGDDRLWTLAEVAAYLAKPKSTLYQWITNGDGPPSYKIGTTRRYDPAEVRAWVKAQASRPAA